MRNIIKTMFGELSPWGKFWLYLGIASLAAAAGMSFAVGWKMTALHAVFLACLSFVTAFLPEATYRAWNEGKRGVAVALTVLAVPLFAIEFGQHAAYTAGVRGVDISQAKVQNAKYDDNRDSVTQAHRDVKSAEARLQQLQWVGVVTHVGLRGQIDTQAEAIRQEERRGGCGPKCLALKQQMAELHKQLGAAEERDSLTKKLAATKAWLESAKTKAAATEHKASQAELMNSFLSESVALFGFGSLEPTASIEKATQTSANFAVAAAGTGLPALALFIAGLYRLKRKDEDTATAMPMQAGMTHAAPQSIPVPTIVPRPDHRTIDLGQRVRAILA